MKIALAALLTGRIRPFGPDQIPSGIVKTPTKEPLWLGLEGFESDAQGDRRHHGGPDKAVHHYPFEHYDVWRSVIGPCGALDAAGAFGENLSTKGVTEADIAIGDVFRLGGAVIEVSQGRQPCWKLNHRFGVADMALQVQRSGRTGWYYRVRQEGLVRPDSTLERIERRTPEWPLARLWRILYVNTLDMEELSAMSALPDLPDSWRRLAERRLSSRKVEDWTKRLSDTAATISSPPEGRS